MRLFGMGCNHKWSKWRYLSSWHIMQERECLSCGKAQLRVAR